nr:lipopolysaccharide assembly protein LapA domain-containing protein [Candidatus Photodesmus katoptron]
MYKNSINVFLFFLALALGSQNQTIVTFNYFFAKRDFYLSILMSIVFVLGFLFSWLIWGCLHLQTQLKLRKLMKKLKKNK